MSISPEEKIRRSNADNFAITNSRLEGLEYENPEITRLYEDYIEGIFDTAELVERTKIIMSKRKPIFKDN